MAKSKNFIRTITDHKDLIKYLVKSDLKQRYKSTVFGLLWVLFDPLMTMAIYVVLIGVILDRGGDAYPLVLLAGLLPFRWFSFSTLNNVKVLLKNARLLQSVRFPFTLLALHEVNMGFINFLVGMVILIPLMVYYQVDFTINLLWLPVLFFVQYLFCYGVGLFFAAAGLYFRDLGEIMVFFTRIALYLSPVLFDLGMIPDRLYNLYIGLNPFASMIDAYRQILVYGAAPKMHFFIFVGYTFLFLIIGWLFFKSRENNFAKDV